MKYEILRMDYIHKHKYGAEVLSDFNINLFRQEFLVLLVRNSTESDCIRDIILGLRTPDRGNVFIDDHETSILDCANSLGIFGIFRKSHLVQTMNIAENIFSLTPIKHPFEFINAKSSYIKTACLLHDIGLSHISPYSLVSELDLLTCHMIEIVKAASQGCRILILDNIAEFYSDHNFITLKLILKQLKENGISVIMLTNKYYDILKAADRVSVVREGMVVSTVPKESISKKYLTDLSAGYHIQDIKGTPTINMPDANVIFTFENFSIQDFICNGTLEISKGETVMFFMPEWDLGVQFENVFLGTTSYSGVLKLLDKPVTLHDISDLINERIALIRKDAGFSDLFYNLSLKENLTIMVGQQSSSGLKNFRSKNYLFKKVIKFMELEQLAYSQKFAFQLPKMDNLTKLKITIAKWLCIDPKIFIFSFPELYLDDTNIKEFKDIVRKLNDTGIPVVIISVNMRFLLQLDGRLLIIENQQIQPFYAKTNL